MRSSLLMSVACAGMAFSAAAMAQTATPMPMEQQGGSMGSMSSVRPMRQPRNMAQPAAQPMAQRGRPMQGAAATDTGARPGNDIGTGQSMPMSNQASNINSSTSRSEIAPRLPSPDARGNTPEAYLAAADRALAGRQTGAAQEALERAETRLLDRSTDPAMASDPSRDPRVMQIGQARQALARRDVAGARSAIQAAMRGGNMAGMQGQSLSGQQPMGQQRMGQPPMGQPMPPPRMGY